MARFSTLMLLLGCFAFGQCPAEAFHLRGGGLVLPPVPEVPGPSAALYAAPYYTCLTNYYVNPSTGSDSGTGAIGDPWQTLGKAATTVTAAGSCINLEPGLYSQTAELDMPHGGNAATPTGYIVWRCTVMPFSFSGGVLQGEGTGCHIKATASFGPFVSGQNRPSLLHQLDGVSYIMFDGIELDGGDLGSNNKNVQGQCIASTGSLNTLTNNIYPQIHHIWVINTDMHDCGEGGIGTVYSDWMYTIHSVSHDGAMVALDMGSGLSYYEPMGVPGYTPTTMDNMWCATVPASICFNFIAAWNVIYHNYNPPTLSTTDGNGIIIDDWSHSQHSCPAPGICPYTGSALVMGNLSFWNGGRGIQIFNVTTSQHAYAVNNISYSNGIDTHGSVHSECFNQGSNNVTWIGNICYEANGDPTFYSSGGSGNTWNNNLAYPAGHVSLASPGTYPTTGPNPNLDGSNPLFTAVTPNTSTQNFALQFGSPARSFAQPFDLWPSPGNTDSGACMYGLANCP